MKHLSPWWMKNCATAVKRKWYHGNISVPIAHGDTGAKEVGVSVSCKDGGVLPDSGFPRVSGMEVRNVQRPLSETVQTRDPHTTHTHSFTGVVSGLYLRSVHSGRNAFEVEVVVHVS